MKKIPEDIRELEEKIARQREKENRLREPAAWWTAVRFF